MFAKAIAISGVQETSAGCWTLRIALETFAWLHSITSSTTIDIHSAATNGYLEQVEILSQIHSLVNFKKVRTKQRKNSIFNN